MNISSWNWHSKWHRSWRTEERKYKRTGWKPPISIVVSKEQYSISRGVKSLCVCRALRDGGAFQLYVFKHKLLRKISINDSISKSETSKILHHNTSTCSFLFFSVRVRIAYPHLPQQLFKNLRSMPVAFGRRLIEREVPLTGKTLDSTSMDLSFVHKI